MFQLTSRRCPAAPAAGTALQHAACQSSVLPISGPGSRCSHTNSGGGTVSSTCGVALPVAYFSAVSATHRMSVTPWCSSCFACVQVRPAAPGAVQQRSLSSRWVGSRAVQRRQEQQRRQRQQQAAGVSGISRSRRSSVSYSLRLAMLHNMATCTGATSMLTYISTLQCNAGEHRYRLRARRCQRASASSRAETP